jgi:amidase
MGVARLAELLRNRQLSPQELLEYCLDRIETLDPSLNAFVLVLDEEARAAASRSEGRLASGVHGPLEGVPIAVKDNRQLAGHPVSQGSRCSSGRPARADAEVVARLRRAGAVLVGKTSLPEFGAVPVTESRRFGATRNPWSVEHTPGGSSGGSAVAVAAGLVPAAEGNDGGGSLRIPGSCCGLFALKPARGRISLGPEGGDGLGGLVCDGFLTRSVADTALLLDVVSGPARGDPHSAPVPGIPFAAAVATAPPRLRVGWTTAPPLEVPVHRACCEAVAVAGGLLLQLGHQLEKVEVPWPHPQLARDFRMVWASGLRLSLLAAEAAGGDVSMAEPHVQALARLAVGAEPADYLLARERLQRFWRSIAGLWERYDVLLTPTLAQPPLRVGELFLGVEQDPLEPANRSDRFSPFTPLANVTGQPSAQLPLHWDAGLPIGVQLIGKPHGEARLLQLSQQLEEASGWLSRYPDGF